LNLGILAHVDAGKTTLTERLLYAAGVIDAPGSVDAGDTQTDSLALERRRGITIKSAVVSFTVGDLTVNLIDTPGHPDFIAEVERVLSVLDGAVLVVSAVEGVQAQTRVLMRALQRLRVPTLLFVNKIDRAGARPEAVLRGIAQRLTPAVVALSSVRAAGSPAAGATASADGWVDVLADHDDALLAAAVDGAVPAARLRRALATQARRGAVHPVLFGSARTGAGVDALIAAVAELLPAADHDAGGPPAGTVFKIERGAADEKVAYVRMRAGTLRTRDRLASGKVTAIEVFDGGLAEPRDAVVAGQIGKLWGLAGVRIGDAIGDAPVEDRHRFAPPTLETVVTARRPQDRRALHVALTQLAEQDPLIGLRQDDEASLSLYGEVQKEVIGATLAEEHGIDVAFTPTTTICIERPVGSGAAVAIIHEEPNPFLATVGLRVDPAPIGTGVAFGLEVELGSMPPAFFAAVEESAREALRHGLYGWEVTDCAIAMTHSGYAARQSHSHAVFDKSMSSTAGDFRELTPIVLGRALQIAGTRVCVPLHRFVLELPGDALGAVLPLLGRLGAVPEPPAPVGDAFVIEGEIPAAQVHALRSRLPGFTRGEGVLESAFARYEPVRRPIRR
jgi:ribosomal protection tetracycline resistance protein